MKTSEEKSRFAELETRIQTIGMVLIVAFLSWVGTGLVDVKVGLAQVLSESIALRSTLDKQERSIAAMSKDCLLYTSPSPRDVEESRMPSSA